MASAVENLGPHLLKRNPRLADPRDYRLSHFLSGDPLDAALAAVLGSWEGKKTKNWAKIITARVKSLSPTPPPPPPPPTPTDVVWLDVDAVLDQGQTGHCVGFGWAGWGDTQPIEDHFVNSDGHAIYYECKIIDGQPGEENGSDVRSGAKAMQNRERLSAYAFASSMDEVKAWLQTHGPIVFGSDWTDDMFYPDQNGFVTPTGSIAGGHCYIGVGDLPSEGAVLCQNSWGDGWGLSGRFKIKYADLEKLMNAQGDACAAVELPL